MLKEYILEDIYIRHAVDDCPNDKYFTMHIHECCEIYFFLSGNVQYLVEGSKYPLDAKSLMIMRPTEAHKAQITGQERYERYAVNFPLLFAHDIDPHGILMKAFTERPLGKNNKFDASEIDMELVQKLFEEMCNDDDDYAKQLTIKTHLLILLDMINRAYSPQNNAKHAPQDMAARIISYVNKHLYEDISVPSLAKHFYISPSQFNRIFKQATGATPWEYITKKRLTVAKEKIHNGTPATKASFDCGFMDYSVFYKAYTKFFGCAPTKDNNKVP